MVSKPPNQVDLGSRDRQKMSHLDKALFIVQRIAHFTGNRSSALIDSMKGHENHIFNGRLDFSWETMIKRSIKGSSDPSHFIFEINVGKRRIRHRTTLKLNF